MPGGNGLLIRLGLRSLWSRRGMAIASIIAVATAIALFVSLELITYSVKYEITTEVKSILPADLMVYTSSAIIPQEMVNILNRMPNIQYAAPGILTGAVVGGHEVTLIGLDSSSMTYFYPELTSGQLPTGGGECIISQQLAQVLGVGVGDYIYVDVPQGVSGAYNVLRLKVVGVFSSIFGGLLGFQLYMVVVPLNWLQNSLGSPGFVNVVFIKVKGDDPAAVNQIDNAVKVLIPQAQVYEQQSIVGTVSQVVNLVNVFFIVVIALSIVIASLIIDIMMIINVRERRREIGIMKAIGASNGQVMLIFLTQALATSAAGGILGIAAGYYGSLAMIKLINMLGYSLNVKIIVAPQYIILGLVLAIAVGVISSIPPLISITKIRPAEVLRVE